MKPIGYTEDGKPIIGPQDGPIKRAMQCPADIIIGGGAAGGGKSVWILLEGARWVHVKDFTGIIFRRHYNDIVDPGGLWDTSMQIYPSVGGYGVRGHTSWTFPASATIKLSHLHNESDILKHQGPAYTYLAFDELTHFTEKMFFYLITRRRNFGLCTIKPYVRASCNPDADSWVAKFISWWWNPETGYPIPERSGVIRHYIRNLQTDEIEWVSPDCRDENGDPPTSVTFFPSRLEDNPAMPNMSQYRAGVMSTDRVTRERLSKGNWLITEAGNLFDPTWVEIIDKAPAGLKQSRYWDLAETETDEDKKNDPCETAGARGGILDGVFYVTDMEAFQKTPGQAEKIMRQTATLDGREVEVSWEESKATGKWGSEYLYQVFEGFSAKADPVKGKKEERFKEWAAWAEFGKVKFVRGDWNKPTLSQCAKFPFGKKDRADAISGLFRILVGPKPILEYYNPTVHFKYFNKERKEFDKIQPQNVAIYGVLWADEVGGIYGGCYLWSYARRKLKVYNEIFQPYPIIRNLADELKEKLIVPIDPQENFVTVRKIFCNGVMAKPGKSNTKKEFQRYGIRLFEGKLLDENSGTHRVNRLFADNLLEVHSDCIETDVQLRRMSYENKKIPSGYPLVRCLLMVEAHITNEMRSADSFRELTGGHYDAKKMIIRDKLRGNKYSPKAGVNQFEYLT